MLLSLDAGYALTIPEMELPQPNNEIMNNIHTLLLAGCLFVALAGSLRAQIPDSVIRVPVSGVQSVRFSPSGNYFLTLQSDTIRVWSVPGAQEMGSPIKMGGSGYAAFLPGDTTIVTAVFNADSVFKVWNWRTGQVIKTVHVFRPLQGAVLSGDGKRMAILVLYPAKQIEYWDIAKEQYQEVLFDAKDGWSKFQMDSAGSLAIVTRGVPTRVVRINLQANQLDTVGRSVARLAGPLLSHDGRLVACLLSMRKPLILDAATLDSLYTLEVPMDSGLITTLDFCGGGRRIVTLSSTLVQGGLRRTALEVWTASTGIREAVLSNDTNLSAASLNGSPRGDYVIVLTRGEPLLWPLRFNVGSTPAIAGRSVGHVSVYPNPAPAEIAVEYHLAHRGQASVRLMSALGQVVAQRTMMDLEEGLHRETLRTDNIPSGGYVCLVATATGSIAIPIVIQH